MLDEPKRVSFLLVIGAMLVVIFIVFEVRAQHECQGGHNCNDDIVGPPTVIDSDDSQFLALSNSLGDVEISGCVITKQFSIIVWARQSWEYDPWCLAEALDRQGKHEYAAKMRCTDKKTAKIYGDDCITVLNFEPPEIDPLDILVGQVPDDRYAVQQEEIEYLREEQASLVGQLEKITQRLEQPPASNQQVQQQIDSAAQRRARARAAYDEKKALAKGSEE